MSKKEAFCTSDFSICMITCPHCQKEFEYKKGVGKHHLSWKTFQGAFLLIVLAMVLYAFQQNNETQLLSSVTTLQTNLQTAYDVFDKTSKSIRGHMVKEMRVQVQSSDVSVITQHAKALITAERNNNPTNIIYIYFYLTDKNPNDLPLERWIAKASFVNFSLIRDMSPGDFATAKNIAPGTYLETRR